MVSLHTYMALYMCVHMYSNRLHINCNKFIYCVNYCAAFLKRGNYNVILIDWSAMTAVPWYTNAVDNMNVVARYVARFIRFLVMQGYPVERVHLIGFSLGAEVAGFIGKQLQEWGINLKRITGKAQML